MEERKIKLLFRLRSMEMGGVQKVLLNILKNLNRNKFDINLLLNLKQGKLIQDIPSDVHVFSIGKGKEYMSKNKYIKYLQLVLRRIKLYYFDFFPTHIKHFIIKKNINIDIAFLDNLVDCLERTKESGTKKIGWIHGDLTKSLHSEQKKKHIVEQFMILDKMIYVSCDTLRTTQTIIKEADINAKVIYNPINVEEIIEKSKEIPPISISSTFNDGIFSFIFVGRIYETKGCKILFETHKKLMQEGIIHKIYLVGGGTQMTELKDMVEQNNLSSSFLVLGEKENPYAYIKSVDSLVLPSYSEGYPLVIAEALILGKPVICTDVGGINEMVKDKVNGLFIEYNEGSLTQGMRNLMTNKELFISIKNNNKNCRTYFDPNKIYNEIETLFLDINKYESEN
jgi:glycosyltransferase involved in cell wall biosynthesis